MSQDPAHYVPGCSVEYRGPGKGGAQWVAVIRRGHERRDCYRAAVPSHDGPDAAARAALAKFNAALNADGFDSWVLLGAALSMDGGNRYAYPVGPSYCAATLPLTAPA